MSTYLKVLNYLGNYQDIINIFAQGPHTLSPYYVIPVNFTSIINLATFSANLQNNKTGFFMNQEFIAETLDLSELYLPAWSGPYTNMSTPTSVTVNPNLAYRYIYFWLQSPGGNGTTFVTSPDYRGGNGGSGSYVFGYIDLSINPITSYSVHVRPQSDTVNTGSTISFTRGVTNITITCFRGRNSDGANEGGIGGEYAPKILPIAYAAVTYVNVSNGITGVNEGDGTTRTKNPYINTNTSYGDKFQPISSAYDSFGAGGAGATSRLNQNQTGTEGFCYVWFKR